MIREKYSNEIISELMSKYGMLLNVINKNKTENFQNDLYRVRIANKTENITEPAQLSYPKINVGLGRCNFENEPVFYCSDLSTTAIAEMLKYKNPTNQYLYLSVWKFKPNFNINIFPLLNKAKSKGLTDKVDILNIISDKKKRHLAKKQLLDIEKFFYDTDHSISASICNILFKRNTFPCDCIFYPSIIEEEKGINISIKPDFVDKVLSFERAYKFELFEIEKGHYEVCLLNLTMSKNNFKWHKSNIENLLLRTLINKDLGLKSKNEFENYSISVKF